MRTGYVEKIVDLIQQRENVRNLSVIAHVDHGKTTLVDSLLAKAGIIKEEDAGKRRLLDSKEEEQQRQITIKSTGISLHYTQDTKEYIVNLVDSPGHVDFSSEVTAALRITDGALVVVDCIEGVCVQTEMVTRQALAERIKPVLHVNKVDRGIMELQLEPEDLYQRLNNIINSVNSLLSKYEDEALGDVNVDPRRGNVSFGSGKQGWAFTLPLMARRLAEKSPGRDEGKILKYLWGDYFYDPDQKRCISSPVSPKTGKKLTRYVCQVLFRPLISLFKIIREGDLMQLYEKILPAIGVSLTTSEKELTGNDLLSRVLQLWLPAGDALVSMIIEHLPSPIQAQKYRADILYTGPADDEVATAIRNCDPNGPLVMFVSKMVPSSDGDRFFAFGRVFSGTIRPQAEVYVMNSDYFPGREGGAQATKNVKRKIPRVVLMMGRYIENVESVPCGNTVGIAGIDSYMTKSGTLGTVPNGYPITPMKFSVSPVVRRALSVVNPVHLPDFVKALKKLSNSDPCLQVIVKDSTGECIVAGAGELHVDVALSDLREFLGERIKFNVSEPVVEYRETVTRISEFPCLGKSPNRHNRFYVTAEPLDPELLKAIDSGCVQTENLKDLIPILVSNYGWSKQEASKIWAFAGTNCLVDQTHGVQNIQEIREHVSAAFSVVSNEGVLTGEPLRGVRINLVDAVLHGDSIHRGPGQVLPAIRRVIFAAILNSHPSLMEPVFLAEIVTEPEIVSKIYALLLKLRGYVIEEFPKEGTPLYILKAHIPVRETFGFTAELRNVTSGRAFPQLLFSHWQLLPGDSSQADSLVGSVVREVRERKRLDKTFPQLTDYNDKL